MMSHGRDNNFSMGWESQLRNLVSEPAIVGYYSVDGQRNYLPNSSGLKYWKPPACDYVWLDLNKGIESSTVRTDPIEQGRISHLLEWIKLNHADIRAPDTSESWIEPKFVCSAKLLNGVMCQFSSIVCAAKWKGTIYMCRFSTRDKIKSKAMVDQKLFSWGFKFEQCMLSEDPCKDPDTSRPVVESAEFRCLFRRCFGKHSVLFSAGMNGLDSRVALKDPLPLNDLRFVDLRINRKFFTTYHYRRFLQFKLQDWWAQSFLANNAKIVCGFRDDDGIVERARTFSLNEIVEMSQKFWNPVDTVMKCQEFLDHVARTFVDDCNETIYTFEQIPYGEMITGEVSPESEYAFIPQSYLDATNGK